jgi:hypothetical protein
MMQTHVVDLQTQVMGADGKPTGVFRYRWRCSCGGHGKRWHTGTTESGTHASAARKARTGGARHVAAMERGKR